MHKCPWCGEVFVGGCCVSRASSRNIGQFVNRLIWEYACGTQVSDFNGCRRVVRKRCAIKWQHKG